MTKKSKVVPHCDYLYLRGSQYQVRVQVPADVKQQLGRGEFKRSLGSDLTVAKRKYHTLVGEFFAQIEAARNKVSAISPVSSLNSKTPDDFDIHLACYEHFRELAQVMRGKVAHPVGRDPSQRSKRAKGYRKIIKVFEAAQEKDAWQSVATQAASLCEQKSWDLDEDSQSFKLLCQTLLRARLQFYRNEFRLVKAKLSPDPDADVLFGSEPPKPIDTLRTLGDLIDEFNVAKEDRWTASTKKNYIIITRVLEEICGRDTLVAEIDSAFCRNIRTQLLKLPANYQKHPSTKGRSIGEAIEIGLTSGLPTIKPATVKSHLNKLGAIVRFGRDEGWILGNPMANVDVLDPVHPSEKRDPFSISHLVAIFSTDPWTDDPPSPSASHASRYWTPLIALYTGARLTDICGQLVEEMKIEDGVKIFDFAHRPGERRIKGGRGRKVPVHSALIELGIWEYVEEARRTGQRSLFTDCKPDTLLKWGDATSKWFARKIKNIGVSGRNLTMHSFRHSFEDALRRADIHDTPVSSAITGRWSPGVSRNYGNPYSVIQLQAAIQKVSYPSFSFIRGKGASNCKAVLNEDAD